jgi:hypothetical protein
LAPPPPKPRRPAGQDSERAIRAPERRQYRSVRARKPVLSGSSSCWFQAEWIMVRSASSPMSRSPMELVPRRARIRHIAVRILYAQPATRVSCLPFPVFGGVSTFPRVSGEGPGLWRRISDVSHQRPRISAPVSARRIFNIRNLGPGTSRDRLRFRRDRFDIAKTGSIRGPGSRRSQRSRIGVPQQMSGT